MVVLLTIVTMVAGGLVWYKQQPKSLPPALNDDNGVMLLIPAGPFLHGPDKTQAVAPAFYIDRTEVTNRMYADFCRATKRTLPPDFRADQPNMPVVNVTIEDAATFAKWAGKRLPDALEWEKAFRGSDGRRHPWGNDSKPAVTEIVIADSAADRGSPYNMLHMDDNVREFTRTMAPTTTNEALYQLRGGSAQKPVEPWTWEPVTASYRSPDTGFRCVKDPPRR